MLTDLMRLSVVMTAGKCLLRLRGRMVAWWLAINPRGFGIVVYSAANPHRMMRRLVVCLLVPICALLVTARGQEAVNPPKDAATPSSDPAAPAKDKVAPPKDETTPLRPRTPPPQPRMKPRPPKMKPRQPKRELPRPKTRPRRPKMKLRQPKRELRRTKTRLLP